MIMVWYGIGDVEMAVGWNVGGAFGRWDFSWGKGWVGGGAC